MGLCFWISVLIVVGLIAAIVFSNDEIRAAILAGGIAFFGCIFIFILPALPYIAIIVISAFLLKLLGIL